MPLLRPTSPWVPVLLTSLVLLTLLGGLTVGDFYWNDLRPDMGRIGANLTQVRDRQRTMLRNFAAAQALLLEHQRRLLARAEDLHRREQEVFEARLEIDAQRAQLAQDLAAEAERQRLAAARLAEAAKQAQTLARGLHRDDELEQAKTAMALAQALLPHLPGPKGEPGRKALAAAQARLTEIQPVDRDELGRRLEALRGRAIALRPVVARLLRGNGQRGAGARPSDPVAQAAKGLEQQFQVARQALETVDGPGFGVAIQGIDRWLGAYYEPRLPDTAAVLAELRALAAIPIVADVAPLSRALLDLAAALERLGADR